LNNASLVQPVSCNRWSKDVLEHPRYYIYIYRTWTWYTVNQALMPTETCNVEREIEHSRTPVLSTIGKLLSAWCWWCLRRRYIASCGASSTSWRWTSYRSWCSKWTSWTLIRRRGWRAVLTSSLKRFNKMHCRLNRQKVAECDFWTADANKLVLLTIKWDVFWDTNFY